LRAIESSKDIPDIQEILTRITRAVQRGVSFRLAWVPSHLGKGVNEHADFMAEVAGRHGRTVRENLPPSAFFPLLKETGGAEWQRR